MLPVIPLAGLLFAAIGIAFSLRVQTIELYSFYFTLFLTPLFLFSDVFFPLKERLAGRWLWVAEALPLLHPVRLARHAFAGQADWTRAVGRRLHRRAVVRAADVGAARRAGAAGELTEKCVTGDRYCDARGPMDCRLRVEYGRHSDDAAIDPPDRSPVAAHRSRLPPAATFRLPRMPVHDYPSCTFPIGGL